MSKPKVYIRADGDSKTGLGHVIRSCAVASMLRSQFDCTFFIREPSEYLVKQIEAAGCLLEVMPTFRSYHEEAQAWAQELNGDEIIMLDGYCFDTFYQQQLKQSACRLVSIDDIHATQFLADIIINHAGGVDIDRYKAAAHTQLFLGFKYALLRSHFLEKKSFTKQENSLLICLGGADPNNDTLHVLKRAVAEGFSGIHVLIGSAYRYTKELQEYIYNCGASIELHQSLDAVAVAELMQQCASAVLSPSSIVLEYMSFGGVVYLYQIAENQQHLKQYLVQSGMAADFSSLGSVSAAEAQAMMETQQQNFDGKSASRIVRLFESLALMQQAEVIRATPEDLEITYSWANDPVARQMSYNNNQITLEDHSTWFMNRIESPETHYFVFRHLHIPFAQIRFDFKVDAFVLSYFIAPMFRNKGLGSFILSEGIAKLQQSLSGAKATVKGYVKKENFSSCHSFEKMQFIKEETNDYPNTYKYTLEL